MDSRVISRFASKATLSELATVAARANWQEGRQGTGYHKVALEEATMRARAKLLLSQSLLELGEPPEGYWDCYLLRYGEGAHVSPHVDPPLFDGYVHVRLNMLVERSSRGGALKLDGEEISLEPGDAVVFRPDRDVHEVTVVESGERLVWSVGCNLPLGRYANLGRTHGRGRRGCRCR